GGPGRGPHLRAPAHPLLRLPVDPRQPRRARPPPALALPGAELQPAALLRRPHLHLAGRHRSPAAARELSRGLHLLVPGAAPGGGPPLRRARTALGGLFRARLAAGRRGPRRRFRLAPHRPRGAGLSTARTIV